MKRKLFRWLIAAGLCSWCLMGSPTLRAGQEGNDSSAKQEAQAQVGKFVQGQPPGTMAGRYHTGVELKRALQTADAVFAAYCRTPLLNPPRGFDVVHNVNADDRSTPRGWPIPVGMGLILVGYDSARRLPSGRFASEGEGPVLGGISINTLDCGSTSAETDLGRDEKSDFYYLPQQTGTMHGWPLAGGEVFMSKRTQPRWLPVSAERVLNVQIEKARKVQKDVDDASPQSAYAKWEAGHAERLRQYQETHDQLAKTNKQQADQMLATMLESEKQTEKMMASMVQPGSDMNKMAGQYQASTGKSLHDLEAQLNSLSPAQKAAPAYVYQGADGAYGVGQVVPAGTPGAVAVVYPNPDFYDRTLPAWEAQSVCISVSTGPRSQESPLYPTIQSIWKSLDWDGIALVLK